MKRDDLVGHNRFIIDNPFTNLGIPYSNIIYESTSDIDKWVEVSTNKVGDWRAVFRSSYIKWALTINGLFLAKDRYDSVKNKDSFVFHIHSLRPINGELEKTVIAKWDSEKAAKAHFDSISLICIYGFIDIYNCLEDFVFDFYRIYLQNNPLNLIKGPEYKRLRKLFKQSNIDNESKNSWELAFSERLDNWQRKKLYDGLGKVFLSYCNESRLEKPEDYTLSTPETWAESINGIAIIRNILTHGGKYVNKELAEFCLKPHSLGFKFIEGEELKLNLIHLQSFELFTDQILTALNISLLEKGLKLRDEIKKNYAQHTL